MDSVLKIVIPGRPLIWQRPKAFYRGKMWHYDPIKKEREALSAELLTGRQRANVFQPYSGDLSVKVAFFVMPHGRRRVDLSNMLKAIEDSGNCILWNDDDQIIHVDAWKHKCEETQQRTEIEIMR